MNNDLKNTNLIETVDNQIFDLFFTKKEVDPIVLEKALQDKNVLDLKKQNINDYLNICLFKKFIYVKTDIKKGKYIHYQKIQALIKKEHIENVELNIESLKNLYEMSHDTNNSIMVELKNYFKKQSIEKLFELLNNKELDNRLVDINISKEICMKVRNISFEQLINNINSLNEDKKILIYKRLITSANQYQKPLYHHIWNEIEPYEKQQLMNHILIEKQSDLSFIDKDEIKPYVKDIINNLNSLVVNKLAGRMTSEKLEIFVHDCIQLNNEKSNNFLSDLQHALLIKNNEQYKTLLDYKEKYFDKIPNQILNNTIKRSFITLKKEKAQKISDRVLEIAKNNNHIDTLFTELMHVVKKDTNNKTIYNTDYIIKENSPTSIWLKSSFKNYLDETLAITNTVSKRRKL